MGCDRGRAAGAAGPRLADVRAHPPQGSRAVHPLGHRDAHRGALARGRCSPRCRSRIEREPPDAGLDGRRLDGPWRRGHRPGSARSRRPQRGFADPAPSMARRSTGRPKRRGSISACCSTTCRGPRTAPGGWPRRCATPARSALDQAGSFRRPGRPACRPGAARPTRSSHEASQRLVAHLTQIESAGAAAALACREAGDSRPAPRSTPCSTARPMRSPKSAAGSTPRPPPCRRWSRRARRASAAPASKLPSCSASGWPARVPRSTGFRRGSPSRSARRSG